MPFCRFRTTNNNFLSFYFDKVLSKSSQAAVKIPAVSWRKPSSWLTCAKREISHAGFEIALTSFLRTLLCVCMCVPIYPIHIYINTKAFLYIHEWMIDMICVINNISHGTFTWQYIFIFCFSLAITSISGTVSNFLLETFRKDLLCNHLLNFEKNKKYFNINMSSLQMKLIFCPSAVKFDL